MFYTGIVKRSSAKKNGCSGLANVQRTYSFHLPSRDLFLTSCPCQFPRTFRCLSFLRYSASKKNGCYSCQNNNGMLLSDRKVKCGRVFFLQFRLFYPPLL